MQIRDRKRTRRNLVLFAVAVLGLAVLARGVGSFAVPSGTKSGTPGLGQLLWLVALLMTMLLLQTGDRLCVARVGDAHDRKCHRKHTFVEQPGPS